MSSRALASRVCALSPALCSSPCARVAHACLYSCISHRICPMVSLSGGIGRTAPAIKPRLALCPSDMPGGAAVASAQQWRSAPCQLVAASGEFRLSARRGSTFRTPLGLWRGPAVGHALPAARWREGFRRCRHETDRRGGFARGARPLQRIFRAPLLPCGGFLPAPDGNNGAARLDGGECQPEAAKGNEKINGRIGNPPAFTETTISALLQRAGCDNFTCETSTRN